MENQQEKDIWVCFITRAQTLQNYFSQVFRKVFPFLIWKSSFSESTHKCLQTGSMLGTYIQGGIWEAFLDHIWQCSEITPVSALRDRSWCGSENHMRCWEWKLVISMEGKLPSHYKITLVAFSLKNQSSISHLITHFHQIAAPIKYLKAINGEGIFYIDSMPGRSFFG